MYKLPQSKCLIAREYHTRGHPGRTHFQTSSCSPCRSFLHCSFCDGASNAVEYQVLAAGSLGQSLSNPLEK